SKDPDLSYIESAARTTGTHLKRGAIVVLESNFLRKNLVKPSDVPLRSSRIIPPPEGTAERLTVFDQTFVKSLRVRNALRAGLQFLAGMRLRGLV
ncbi:MAG: hypothetical protein U9N09_00335, partial [Euryarchaeota archaeon]|nr:hypothetical protein [Euryarchaeota archaeon]